MDARPARLAESHCVQRSLTTVAGSCAARRSKKRCSRPASARTRASSLKTSLMRMPRSMPPKLEEQHVARSPAKRERARAVVEDEDPGLVLPARDRRGCGGERLVEGGLRGRRSAAHGRGERGRIGVDLDAGARLVPGHGHGQVHVLRCREHVDAAQPVALVLEPLRPGRACGVADVHDAGGVDEQLEIGREARELGGELGHGGLAELAAVPAGGDHQQDTWPEAREDEAGPVIVGAQPDRASREHFTQHRGKTLARARGGLSGSRSGCPVTVWPAAPGRCIHPS